MLKVNVGSKTVLADQDNTVHSKAEVVRQHTSINIVFCSRSNYPHTYTREVNSCLQPQLNKSPMQPWKQKGVFFSFSFFVFKPQRLGVGECWQLYLGKLKQKDGRNSATQTYTLTYAFWIEGRTEKSVKKSLMNLLSILFESKSDFPNIHVWLPICAFSN